MARVTSPWKSVAALGEQEFAHYKRRAIFDCFKWDPQVGDVCTLARGPLLIDHTAWREVTTIAEQLAREVSEAETELIGRPDLHKHLGLPRRVRHQLARLATTGANKGAARIVRFDFHYTTKGWRISEANSDVPGGLNEASGLPRLMAPYYSEGIPVGDPAEAYASAILSRTGTNAAVALVHATAYSDDRQMMAFTAQALERSGIRAHLASPAHLRWSDGRAQLHANGKHDALDLIVRFFPTEWLPNLPSVADWPHFFSGSLIPISNPATAVVTQTKRFPLAWHHLRTPLPTWRALLPETRDPRDVPWQSSEEWVLKPALGRVGEGIGLRGIVAPKELQRIARSAWWRPGRWVAQRRFNIVPIEVAGQLVYPCLGVYTIDGKVAGAYGRVAHRPFIDASAADAAVLAA